MRRRTLHLLAAALALVLLPGTAAAERYIGAGIGKGAPLRGDLADQFSTADTHHGRLVLGTRFGPLAVEGAIFGTELQRPGSENLGTLSVGVDLKYHFGLMPNLSAYVKGGIHRTWLQDPEAARGLLGDYAGSGHTVGAGLELRLALVNLWLDYNRPSFVLQSDQGPDIHGGAKMLTLGASLRF